MKSLKGTIEKLADSPRDEGAWRELYQQLWPFVFSIVYRRLKNRSTAEDAAQQVFVQIWDRRPFRNIRDEAALRAYLWKTALNVVSSHWRKVSRKDRAERHLLELQTADTQLGDIPAADDRLVMEEALELLLDTVQSDDRQFLEMLIQGSTLGEAAAALDMSYSNAGVRYYRLKRRLRKLLIDNDKISLAQV